MDHAGFAAPHKGSALSAIALWTGVSNHLPHGINAICPAVHLAVQDPEIHRDSIFPKRSVASGFHRTDLEGVSHYHALRIDTECATVRCALLMDELLEVIIVEGTRRILPSISCA